jgi:hypothetical protein
MTTVLDDNIHNFAGITSLVRQYWCLWFSEKGDKKIPIKKVELCEVQRIIERASRGISF